MFTIFKFRTMIHASDSARRQVTTAGNQRFTPVGPFLRRWKLDELPQMMNILLGHMSLVGPRPKIPEHVKFDFSCRPGITGAATIAFAHEEIALDRVPRHQLDIYYHDVVLPTKRGLDIDYMARATFLSDLKLIFNSVLRRWDSTVMDALLNTAIFGPENHTQGHTPSVPEVTLTVVPMPERGIPVSGRASYERLKGEFWRAYARPAEKIETAAQRQ